MLHAGYTLGSQADAPVLVDQPLAVITQKAKVKRDRRTEWEYYVQFPDFPESEGQWYSARNILAQHKCGAQLIREFEGGGDAPDSRLQQAQQAMPLTQDAGPSQIGSFSAASIPSSTQHNQMYTQEQAPSQMHQQESAPAGNQSGGLSAGQMAMARAYQPSDSNALQTVNQQQPPLYWSFERLQQAQTGALHSLPNQGMHAEHQYTHQPQRLMAGLAQVSQPLARQLHPASHAAMPPALHAGTQPLSRDLVQQQQQWQQNHQRHPYQQQSHQQYPHQQPHQQQQIHHQHPLQQQPQQQQTRQEDSVGVSTVHLTQAYPSALTGRSMLLLYHSKIIKAVIRQPLEPLSLCRTWKELLQCTQTHCTSEESPARLVSCSANVADWSMTCHTAAPACLFVPHTWHAAQVCGVVLQVRNSLRPTLMDHMQCSMHQQSVLKLTCTLVLHTLAPSLPTQLSPQHYLIKHKTCQLQQRHNINICLQLLLVFCTNNLWSLQHHRAWWLMQYSRCTKELLQNQGNSISHHLQTL